MTVGREDRLLLRAALRDGHDALDAWNQWRALVDLDAISWPSLRLVPLLWHNLVELGVQDVEMERYRTVFRQMWLAGQSRLLALRRVEAALAERGVQTLVLKGVALAHGYYHSPGFRPMDDLDVLIRPADAPAAAGALRDAGWSTLYERPERVLQVVHAQEFRDSRGTILDLHGHLFQGSLHSSLDAERWSRAERLELADGPLRVLDPTDQLLHVLVHGAESDPPAPRWVADATIILRRRGPDVDWSRLVADAEAESRGVALTTSLAELSEILPEVTAGAAAVALDALRGVRRSRSDRLEARVAAGWRLFLIRRPLERVVDHRRWRRSGGAARRRTGLLGYLALNWDADGSAAMVGNFVRRGFGALARDLRASVQRLGVRRRSNPAHH